MSILYKYKSIAKEECKKHIEEMFDKSVLWYSKATALNDPYEAEFVIDPEDLRKKLIDGIMKKGVSKELATYECDKLLSAGEFGDVSADKENTLKAVRETVCIYSLAKECDNILMWSHYSDNHRGIVIEFDIPNNINIYKVKYKEKLPFYSEKYLGNFEDSEMYDFALTKHISWGYEKEYRVFRVLNEKNDGKGIKTPFDKKIIKKIILGAKISNEDRIWVREKGKENSIPVFQATLSKTEHKILINNKELI